jgi:acylphosphatase
MAIDKILCFLRELGNQSVDYVLVGAIGLTVHGIVRATQDVDVFLRPEEGNVLRMRNALKQLFPEDASIDEITAEDLAGEYPAIRYNSPDGSLQIDILARLGNAFSFEDIQFETMTYEGVQVRVATPEMLYRMKKSTVRLQDRADAEVLKEIFGLKE